MLKMQEIMGGFRKGVDTIGTLKVENTLDYSQGIDMLPKSDVIKYLLDGGSSVVIRPSGTEPKLKAYISIIANDKKEATAEEQVVLKDIERYLQKR